MILLHIVENGLRNIDELQHVFSLSVSCKFGQFYRKVRIGVKTIIYSWITRIGELEHYTVKIVFIEILNHFQHTVGFDFCLA